jgi:23S rRNA-/tRNA-specific pseudouridylate synthase
MAVVADGRAATTRYKVREYYDGYTLVEVEPLTGRTHQIRVHLASLGHPIVGDQTYGHASALVRRQFLHALRLRFRLPSTGEEIELEAALPEDLQSALDGIEGTSAKGDNA